MALEQELIEILTASPVFQKIEARSSEINLKNWYVAGGCVTQTVWNHKMGLHPSHGLKDVDLIYFDDADEEKDESENQKRIELLFPDLGIPIDVKNQALVHTWYAGKFGYDIHPYKCTEDGIRTWLSAFAVGVRPTHHQFEVFAPFGLVDLFSMRIRPNKAQITEAIYLDMCRKFKLRWPSVEIEPWVT